MFYRGDKTSKPSSPSSAANANTPPIITQLIQHPSPQSLRRRQRQRQRQRQQRNDCVKQVAIVGCSLLVGVYFATFAMAYFLHTTIITTVTTPFGMMRYERERAIRRNSRASSFPHQVYLDHVTNTVTAIRKEDLSMLDIDIHLTGNDSGNESLVWNVGGKHDQNFEKVMDEHVSNSEEGDEADGEDEEDSSSSEEEQDTCEYMHEWQKPGNFFSSCNQQHEIAVHRGLELLNCGGDRCAFRLPKEISPEPIVLKMTMIHKEIHDSSMARALVDAKVMERLTKSHYVENIYSSCGMSQLLDLGEEGGIVELVRASRKAGHDTMDPTDKLKILIQIVSSIADLHSFEDDGIVSVTHNDICCHQFILIDGIYKLNDFHLATMSKKDYNNNSICKQYNSYNSRFQMLHAPEEASGELSDREKDDVYMMGNVMYYVFTKQWLFINKSVADSINAMLKKKRSAFPSGLDLTTIPANKAMHKAILMAWHHDPRTRLKARDIRDYLLQQLSKIEGKTITPDTIIRVSVPPMPAVILNRDDDDFHDVDRDPE